MQDIFGKLHADLYGALNLIVKFHLRVPVERNIEIVLGILSYRKVIHMNIDWKRIVTVGLVLFQIFLRGNGRKVFLHKCHLEKC